MQQQIFLKRDTAPAHILRQSQQQLTYITVMSKTDTFSSPVLLTTQHDRQLFCPYAKSNFCQNTKSYYKVAEKDLKNKHIEI